MVLGCLRTKLCKMLMMVVLAVIGVTSLLLWNRAMREGSVELVLPVDDFGKTLSITIVPEAPAIEEGSTAQLVCVVTGATVVEFAPPPSLHPSLISSVHVSMLPGGAVMIVERVKRGHAGVYTCQARGDSMKELKQSVELVVNTGVAASLETQQNNSSSSPSHSVSPHSPSSHLTTSPVTTLTTSHSPSSHLTTSPITTSHSPSSHLTTSPVTSSHSPSSHLTTSPATTLTSLHSPSSHLTTSPVTTLTSSHSPSSHLTTSPVTTLTSSQNPSSPSHPSLTLAVSTGSTASANDRVAITRRSSQSLGGQRTVDVNKRRASFHDYMMQRRFVREVPQFPELDGEEDMPAIGGEKQMEQIAAVEDYCMKYDPHPSTVSHPFAYGRHMLVDDTHSVAFCFLPKVGCTNLKLLFFVSQGLIPQSELDKSRDKINQTYLMKVVRNSSLMNFHRKFNKQHYTPRTFFKYVMVRNPLERLASAFRSKIERYNLTGRYRDTPHYNWARRQILEGTHPIQFKMWIMDGMKPIAISFSDFIDYWLEPKNREFKYDDHFMSMLQICQPCRTRFNYYGNFHHFERDAQVLIDKIGASSLDLRQGYYSEETATDQRMKSYYSTLSDEQKRAVLRKMALELEFHYTIFPEERDSHKHILGIDAELTPYLYYSVAESDPVERPRITIRHN